MTARSRLSARLIPIALLIVAMTSIQSGASLAKQLFPVVGAQGTTALRLGFGAIILVAVLRPWREWRGFGSWKALLGYGVSLGLMNLLFYMSVRTVPLGIAVALEFTGPLALAMCASRRWVDFVWIALAVTGVLLLLPLGGRVGALDPKGAGLALVAGLCWALYIIFGQRAGAAHGAQTAAIGGVVAAIVAVPVGVAHAGGALLSPALIPVALGVAVLSTALPYTLEMMAMTRLPARTFGVLMSIEPALGALAGMLFLGELLTPTQWAAIGAIILASAGSTATAAPKPVAPIPD
ncbi:threonine/homoserine exporter RhtA [Opitutaceae bacterium TAV4]|uniref:threonine/homoserine exporter RhtA n=1 Tax=Geminisphaera colitermitum TaxID=1148786 RepID=UPI000158C771|nr:threonine/homoserine exporter RhtA [Geminisphaera colitermitum]RRJ96528.1 threonine/homoserine exporter RhtA [Opitutaceae bacterium TAV4]RRK00580.1 threonine/homoserine exporter RhtA [Opitutaceae bacterium TAV3]